MSDLRESLRRAVRTSSPFRVAAAALMLLSFVVAGFPLLRRGLASARGRPGGQPRLAVAPLAAPPITPAAGLSRAVKPPAPLEAAPKPKTFAGLPISALGHRNYRFYWFGTAGWIFGEFFRFLAQAWLVFEITGDAFYLGVVSAAGALPTILLSPIAGVLADRLDRRRILMVAQTVTGTLMLGTGLLILSGQVQVWHLLLVAFVSGTFQALDEPARQSLMPSLVPREDLPSAISMGNSLWSIGQVASPGAAGFLLAYVGAGPCFFVTAAGFWTSVIMLAFVRVPKVERTGERHGAFSEMRAGFSFIFESRVMRSLLLISLAIGAFGYAAFVLAPVFAVEILNVGAVGLGIMEGFAGVGGLAGTLLAARLGFDRRRGAILVAAAVIFGLLLIVFGLSRDFYLTCAVMLGIGFFDGIFINLALTVGQLSLPDELRGRVMGIWGLTWFMPPFGGMLGGLLTGIIGAPATIALFGAIVALLAFVVGAPGLRPLSATTDRLSRTRPAG